LKALVERFGDKIGVWLWNLFTVHYTPKHGSWLDQAELEISLFSRPCLGQRRIPSLSDLRRENKAWNRKMNRFKLSETLFHELLPSVWTQDFLVALHCLIIHSACVYT
jgi:hypothetical protein